MNFQNIKKRQFSTSELSRNVGDVTHAASEAPVTITHHNKVRYVLMSIAEFERLNPQRAYNIEEIPDEIIDWMLPALDGLAAGDFEYES
jgi:prevent-host-death family protein